MKKNIILLFSIMLVFVYSCEMLELDKLDSPNNTAESDVGIEFVLNAAQMDFVNFTAGQYSNNQVGLSTTAMRACRMIHHFGSYTGGFSDMTSTSLNGLWEWANMGVLANADLVIKMDDDAAGAFNYHAGMAKVLKAYAMVTLVDFFGEVPYEEAFQGAGNLNPGPTDDEAIYASALSLLDEAIVDFGEGAPTILPHDMFYNNVAANWVKLANSIKLKIYLNRRLIDAAGSTTAINAIVSSGNYITSATEDFQFQFSAVNQNPDSRHPDYIDNYLGANAGSYFMSNYLIFIMKDEKTNRDPRLRYYMYRQTDDDPRGDDLPCTTHDYEYCYLGEAYWGRDHTDDDGIPNDNGDRTTWGVYPIGGAFDNNQAVSTDEAPGDGGAGIFPIMLSSWVNFMLLESNLTLGTTGTAATYFDNGVSQSINKVLDFGAVQAEGSNFILNMDSSAVVDYIEEANTLFTDAATPAEQLDVAMKEYFIALYGNGIELYNMYRRTGLPSDIQAPVIAAGPFPRLFPYPNNLIDRNTSFSQRPVTNTVFWDNNSTNLN